MLTVRGLDVFYGDLQALWDVSLNVRPAAVTSLIGSNGSGKSTLQLAITGLVRAARGSITIGGTRLDKQPAHRIVESGVSMVPEGRRLFPEMTVLDNLEMGAFTRNARQHLGETLDWVYSVFPRLAERSNQRSSTLSGGEQQMLAIGRALMSEPKYLLIDELSLGLAPVTVQKICETLKEVNQSKGIAILMVEQNVRMALELSDYGYIIENGRITGEGKSLDLLSSDTIKDAYLGVQ